MAGTDYLDHLATIPLFKSLSKKELGRVAKATDELDVPHGKVLTEQGRAGHEAFIIVKGEAAVEVGGREVARLGEGDHFGELALLDGGPRTATVRAVTDVSLLVISQPAFFSLLDEVPGLSWKILTSMAAIIRDLDQRLHPMTH